ncbi:assimilatory nitrate reductase electron transfer subunit [Asanoa hainanensis]|uniref:Assimilatory nitrate reductase electron transfer subunit n=1 Tax=Asanoa hainanensis TaxID=560556 RepID=A0A239IJN7_9ACTN|nr:FAD-dependent oxidoreductase [Asanoa hainanensis]SNS93827.1 assimilatory nitrate reductase electron transfer subunit [Asanoa hainanensis]
MRVLVVGYGMAGSRAVAELRSRDADVKVTALGAEPHRPYNRILLSSLLAGKVGEDDLAISAAPSGADVRLGERVVAVDPGRRVVRTTREEHEYDALVLATGGLPVFPSLQGLDSPDVYAFRTLDDCRRIVARADGARRAVVLGGGLLGLEAARGLAGRGLAVDVVHVGTHLMDRQLDGDAGRVLARTLAGLGVRTHVGASAREWTGNALHLDGAVIPADLLVLACGVRPDTRLAAAAGLTVGRGIVVDDAMRTSDPHVYAIGDCAEHRGSVYGLVAPAWDQAATVADRITGGRAAYRGSRVVTRLKASDVDLAAMGSLETGADAEVVSFADPARGTYARLVLHENRITGAVLLGDNPAVGTVVQLFDRDAEAPADRRTLLLGRAHGADPPVAADSPALMPDAAVVCRCNTVRKAAITAVWRAGGRTVADVAAATRATTGCGGCREAVCGLVDWLSMVDPDTRDPDTEVAA